MHQTILGLTGSIGMGKSTTVNMFRDLEVPVWDADEAVSQLYQTQTTLQKLASIIPQAISDKGVDRVVLKRLITEDPSILTKIEEIIHPAVQKNRSQFLIQHSDKPLIVLDVPLLFETGGDKIVDKVLVVTTSPKQQKERVLSRGTMTEDMLNLVLSRQLPDAEKRARADFVIETNTPSQTRADVVALIELLKGAKCGKSS